MTDYTPIDCGDYDYLEIACMDRYEIEVAHAGGLLVGVADGLETRNGEEFLCVRLGTRSGGNPCRLHPGIAGAVRPGPVPATPVSNIDRIK